MKRAYIAKNDRIYVTLAVDIYIYIHTMFTVRLSFLYNIKFKHHFPNWSVINWPPMENFLMRF